MRKDKMKKIRKIVIGSLLAASLLLTGCNKSGKNTVKLDPKNPVTITVWHYYNGAQQVAFDELVQEFNHTIGKEEGIYVEGHSQGNVTELENNVLAALNKEVGSNEPPNIFSSYADTAYAIEKMGYLADISNYIEGEELEDYVDSYIEEGRIGENGELRIFPTAKSSEILMLNKTDWEIFSKETNTGIELLSTCEGLAAAAEQYYEWTDAKTPEIENDGKAFYGRDAMANLFIIGSMQLGNEIFEVNAQKVTLNINKEVMKKIWDCYYIPYIKGYFNSYGKFRSDDVKIGELLAFTGSTTSTMYFPDEVELEQERYPIDYIVLPAPIFENGKSYAVQQGAGMVVREGKKEEEYASVLFLKWFTKEENNIMFGCSSGYLPVKKEAYQKEVLDRVIEENKLEVSKKTYDTLLTSFDVVKEYTMYTNKAFDGGSAARKVLEHHLQDKAVEDRELVKENLANGMNLEQATENFCSDENFKIWFDEFCIALQTAINGR